MVRCCFEVVTSINLSFNWLHNALQRVTRFITSHSNLLLDEDNQLHYVTNFIFFMYSVSVESGR